MELGAGLACLGVNPDKHIHHCKKVYLSIDASTLHSKRISSSPPYCDLAPDH